MAAMLPRESGNFIASCAKNVFIKQEGVKKVAKLIYPELEKSLYSVKSWRKHDLHPKELCEATVDWIFLVDTLNFSFWVDEDVPPFVVKYRGKCYTGYWALCAAINRALEVCITSERSKMIKRSLDRSPFKLNLHFCKKIKIFYHS